MEMMSICVSLIELHLRILTSCDHIFVSCTLYCQSSVKKGGKSNYQMVSSGKNGDESP